MGDASLHTPAREREPLAIGLLHADPREAEVRLSQCLAERGAHVEMVDVRHFDVAACLHLDCVLNRVYPSTAFEQASSVLDDTIRAVRTLEQNGVWVLSGSLATLTDYRKSLAADVMTLQSVRTPVTVAVTPTVAGGPPPFLPAVLKPEVGAFGRDCVLVTSAAEWRSAIATADWLARPRIVQTYVRPVDMADYRVTVMFGDVVFASRRELVGGWVGNNSDSPTKSDVMNVLPDEVRALAIHSTQAVGAYCNGVDVMIDEEGPIVIENNPTFGFPPGSPKVPVFAARVLEFLTTRRRALEGGASDRQVGLGD